MMVTQGKLAVVVMGMLGVLVLGAPALGEQTGSTRDEWSFSVAPYLWMTSMKGSATIRGTSGKVDATFGDLLDDLDTGASLYLGVRKGVWGVFLDAFYAKISADGEVLDTPTKVTIKNTFLDLGVTRQLYEGPWYSQGNKLWWDFRAAVRYYDLDGELAVEGGSRESGGEDWIDPMLGLALTTEVSDHWLFTVRGDIGGFGIGSRFAWDLRLLLGYTVTKNIDLWVGWEHRDIDYSSGRGDDLFEYDLYYTGPILGASFTF